MLDDHVAQLRLPELPLADPREVGQLADLPNVLRREMRVDRVEDAGRHVAAAGGLALVGKREARHEAPLFLCKAVAALEEGHVAVAGAAGSGPSPRPPSPPRP